MQNEDVKVLYQIIDEAYKIAFNQVSLNYYTDEEFLNYLDSGHLYQIFDVNFYYIISDYGRNSYKKVDCTLKALKEIKLIPSGYHNLPIGVKDLIEFRIQDIEGKIGKGHFRKNQKSESDFAKHFEALVIKMNSNILELLIEDNGPDSKDWVIKIHSIAFKNYLPKLIQKFVSRSNIEVEFSINEMALKKRIERILDKKKA